MVLIVVIAVAGTGGAQQSSNHGGYHSQDLADISIHCPGHNTVGSQSTAVAKAVIGWSLPPLLDPENEPMTKPISGAPPHTPIER
jgi:hypothetical protein